jgi:hypothetical protein
LFWLASLSIHMPGKIGDVFLAYLLVDSVRKVALRRVGHRPEQAILVPVGFD